MNDKTKSMSQKRFVSNTIVHVILSIMAIIWILPLLWVILTSFRKEKGSEITYLFPKAYTLDNYINILTDTSLINFPKWFFNTFIVAVFSCILATFFTLSVSYTMSRLRFKMRRTFMNIALVLGMFPGFMSMIAIYYILKGLGLTQGDLKLVALVLVYSGGAGLGFYTAKGFFDTIPKALDEAAYIDGATKFQVFWKITVPLSKPIIIQTILMSFMGPWLDFIFAKVICGTETEYYTVAIGLWSLLEKEYVYNYFTQFAAGSVLVSIPVSILFIKMQKYYVDGLSGAVKG